MGGQPTKEVVVEESPDQATVIGQEKEPEKPLPSVSASDKMWTWPTKQTATPNPSAHGGNHFGSGSATPGNSAHGGVSFWNWSAGRAPDPNSSAHGGNAFAPGSGAATPGNSAHGGVSFYNWSAGRAPDPDVTPGNSAHGGNNFGNKSPAQLSRRNSLTTMWDWGKGRDPDASASASEAGSPTSARPKRQSHMWDWGSGRAADPNSSAHGGNAFLPARTSPAATPGNSAHGGVSFWNWSAGRAPDPSEGLTPNPSAHGGNHFAPGSLNPSDQTVSVKPDRESSRGGSRNGSTHGGGILRNVNWGGKSPNTSRSSSVHGGVHFSRESVENSKERGDISSPPMQRRMSLTSMWDWGLGRESEPASPAPTSPPPEPTGRLDATPPPAPLPRSDSAMWDWGAGRESNPNTNPNSPESSRESSMHNGEGKTMPWAMKIKYGNATERPV